MADCRTVKEFADFFAALVKEGHGDTVVLFDTEARTFNYHMAKVGRAYYQGPEFTGDAFVSLHEFVERYQQEPPPINHIKMEITINKENA